jgi:hypothetical protein
LRPVTPFREQDRHSSPELPRASSSAMTPRI